MFTYLTMTVGDRAGNHFLLDQDKENLLGRALDCAIVLSDPLCSRVHTVIIRENEIWHIRDGKSRNGTYVNDQKIDEAVLDEGHHVRVGSTEFCFHQSDEPPTIAEEEVDVSQTLVKDTQVGTGDTGLLAVAAIGDSRQAQDLLLLYQLSIKLLGCARPSDVLREALELLLERTSASVVGFLSVGDDGRLTAGQVLPEQAKESVAMSQSLTHLVLEEARAVWIAKQRSNNQEHSLARYADALCVPLVHDGAVIGAVHVYREDDHFRQSHFDFAISLANIAAVALARARHDISLESDYRRLQAQSGAFDEIMGQSPTIEELKQKIHRLARTTGCVLVRGESGVGKELVARALHRASPRADRPLLSVNCAAIPQELMESQLFGHKAGAFTGAEADHVGFFQQASLGTLFLDEIGELTLPGQAKLLRVLEGHPFLPVGGTKEVKVDVRVIAATNQDLQIYAREKKFREDLYYRLCVFELHVPPLRERGDDIELLVDHFLDHFRRQHGRPELTISDNARKKLLGYEWPGNIRQLRNSIDSAVVMASGSRIEPDDLGLHDAGGGDLETLRLDHWQQKLIREALKRVRGSVPEAAKLLGIGRATLYRRIEEYGIQR